MKSSQTDKDMANGSVLAIPYSSRALIFDDKEKGSCELLDTGEPLFLRIAASSLNYAEMILLFVEKY